MLRILLLQARLDVDPMAAHEHGCFVRETGLAPEQIVPHDLCLGPPSLEQLRRFDAVSVGGAGDFYVSKGNLPHWEGFLDFLRELVESGHPTFASCFGYQSMVVALGGEVIHDPENTEVGTYELSLTDEGRADELFRHLPETFDAQLGHKDRARCHPVGLPNLVTSPRSPFQALRIPGKAIWATQFHPELNRETNLDRFRHYQEGYATYMSPQERQRAENGFCDSHEVCALLPRFLEHVFP